MLFLLVPLRGLRYCVAMNEGQLMVNRRRLAIHSPAAFAEFVPEAGRWH